MLCGLTGSALELRSWVGLIHNVARSCRKGRSKNADTTKFYKLLEVDKTLGLQYSVAVMAAVVTLVVVVVVVGWLA